MSSTSTDAASARLADHDYYVGPRYSWFVVFVLSTAGIISFIDRQVINLLVDPIKADLGLSDTQISFIQGAAFAVFHAIFAVPLARLSDLTHRKWLITVGTVFWSIAAAGCGLAKTFYQLFIARMLVGIGEATLSPAGFSMLSDYFPRKKLTMAISVFTGSSFVGSGVALLVGGYLVAMGTKLAGTELPVFGELRAWQFVFVAAASLSLPLLVLLLFVKEPPRREAPNASAEAQGVAFKDVLRFLGRRSRVITAIFVGFSLVAAAQFGIGSWLPTFFIRTHDWSAAQIGSYYGTIVISCGAVGVVAGGWISDRLTAKGYRDANLRVPFFGVMAAIPFAIAYPLVEDPYVAIALVAPMTFFGNMPFGAGTAALPLIAPNRMRGQVVAMYLLVANLIGQGLGPSLVAVTTDYVWGSPELLQYSLVIVPPILYALGVMVIGWGRKPFSELTGLRS